MGEAVRWFIGAATTLYGEESGFEDRPELADEVERMATMFADLGYARVPGFGINLAVGEFQNRLRRFLISPDRRESDIVVVYYTGHGHLDEGSLLLPMADTTADVAYTAMPAADLTGRLLSGPVIAQKLLFILDTCYAAAAGRAMAGGATEFLARLRGLADTPSVGIVVAARPHEKARSGAFTQALVGAVNHRASGGHEPEFLPLDGLVSIANATTPTWQHARLFLAGDGITEFFPNPRLDRWLRDLDLRNQALHQVRAARRTEQRDHVLPRAQGLDTAARVEDLWLFTGRHQALRKTCRWLKSPDERPTMVVTGDPGSGKSALLSRLFVLADRKLRSRVPRLHTLPGDTLPTPDSITRFIHARGLTVDELMAGLCEACGLDETISPGQLLASVSGQGDPIVVIIDALDEVVAPRDAQARGRFPVVDEALAPLVRGASRTRLRLLLGTRRHLLDALGGPVQRVDLDDSTYADPPSMAAYARSCLTGLSDQSLYRSQPREYLDAVADAIAAAADNSFLVTLITARSLALRSELVSPTDRKWQASLPRAAADAMRDDMHSRLGDNSARARDLLMPLAYAQGTGLPWEDIWPLLARMLSGTPCASTDLDWLIEEAGYYIVESTSEDGRRSVYRLYHEALAEHLRAGRADPTADHAAIVDALTGHTPRLDDGRTDWDQAHPYTRANLATHAAGTDRLDPLLTDPRFQLAASRPSMLAALASARTADGRACADAYRRAEGRLGACPIQDRPAYLQLAARCGRANDLADNITTSGLPLTWTTDWASWRLQPAHRIFTGHSGTVRSVAVGELDGRPIVASGSSDDTVRVWDLATGTPVGDPLTGHGGTVNAVAVRELGGRPIVVSGGDDDTVRVWDLATGTPVGDPFTGHSDWVRSVAVGELGGRPIVVSGGDDRTVRVCDLATGTPVGDPLTGHSGTVRSVAVGELDGRPIVASGSSDRTVRVWDLATGTPVGDPLTGHSSWVNAVAVGELDGRPIVASGGDDRTVRVWDLATGTPVGDPLTGHSGTVRSVAVGVLGGRPIMVSGSSDGTVRVWDLATGTPVGDPLTGHSGTVNAVAVGELDGRPIVASAGDDRTVRVWDLATGTPVGDPFTGHSGTVRSVAVGVLGGRPIVASGSSDDTVRVWDLATGTPVGDPFTGHSDWVNAVAVGELDGRPIVASGSDDGTVRVWDLATGTPVGDPFTGHSGTVRSVVVGELGGRPIVVSGSSDRTVRVWDVATGTPVGDPLTGHSDWVRSVAVGELGGRPIVASGGDDRTVRVWDLATGTPVGDPLTGHSGTVNAVAVGELGGRPIVVSAGDDRTVRVWDAATGTPVGDPLTGHSGTVRSVAVGELGGRPIVASGSSDGTVRVWDLTTGTPVGDPFTGHSGTVNAVAVGELGGRPIVASAGDDRTVRVWDAATGTPVGDPFTGHGGTVNAVAVGELGGRPIVVSGSDDGTVRVWDLATGTPVGDPFTGHSGTVRSVAVGELDGRPIVASGSDDRTVRVWDLATGTPVGDPFTGHSGTVRSVAVGELGGRPIVASGSSDSTVRVWDLATGTPVGDPFTGHSDWVRSVAVGELGGRPIVASGGDDRTVRVWDLATGTPVGDPFTGHSDWVNAVAVGELGGRPIVASGSSDGTVRVWDLATGTPVGDPLTGHSAAVSAVAVRVLDGHHIVVAGSYDGAVRVWDTATRSPMEDPPWTRINSGNPPSRIDLAAPALSVAYVEPCRLVIATELGIVSIRLPGLP